MASDASRRWLDESGIWSCRIKVPPQSHVDNSRAIDTINSNINSINVAANNTMDAALEMTSPGRKAKLAETIQSMANLNSNIENMESPMDPDAQATITDFLDFTEYLPSDLVRSLALISDLDEKYVNASSNLNDLTKTYGHLPDLPADTKPDPVSLRKDISTSLTDALGARTLAFAEASHLVENVERHYKRAQNILAKLQTMAENYPESRETSPVPQKPNSPVSNRLPGKLLLRTGNPDGRMRVRKRRAPIITVPGEVMAPYELDYDSYDSYSDDSESDAGPPTPRRQTPARSASVNPKIKLKVKPAKKEKVPKAPRTPRPPGVMGTNVHSAVAGISTSNALAKLQPPPPDAKAGTEDAPWLQLTAWELAKLRKRMKKNAVWSPSDTMIARELKQLGRGIEAYRTAKSKADAAGQPFEQSVPPQLTGKTVIAEGAISAEALGTEEIQLSNRGMKLNEAKKLKREAAAKELAKLAAEEAEESVRKMTEAASTVKSLFGNHPEEEKKEKEKEKEKEKAPTKTPKKQPASKKRKRESTIEDVKANGEANPSSIDGITDTNDAQGDKVNEVDSSKLGKPQFKRTKTETPVPPPHPIITNATPRATPVPTLESAVSVASSIALPVPATDTPISSTPVASVTASSPPKSSTPILPPGAEKKEAKKEARKAAAAAKKEAKEAAKAVVESELAEKKEDQTSEKLEKTTNTRATRKATPVAQVIEPTTPPVSEPLPAKRPTSSRGKAAAAKEAVTAAAIKAEEPISAAPMPAVLDRPRRTSTARNTPAPETRQPSKRAKRPAPGVVTLTTEGGSTAVSVGKRRAAPRKKAGQKKEKKDGREGSAVQEVLDEVDDDGNLIDPNEQRYCICNRVSFGTMIACENDNCEKEWFHLECVEMTAVPPRTTKWYCPDCRIILGIGEKGEVNARGRKS
ncbi:uncharacterized protein EAF02_006856 [Botrytis sinoallii]|uniref:uncharacterized protein n=1 Tax=Botrytis sinoallii TaxID=1463999 RepID=UPI0018FF9AB8|nr:uncharacterized protein EAF02_006856 [Botrytis sinoallii]KAF7880965.1 hypothetical protein EAF02_006856 [Botrytis sinoallii]